MRDLKSLFDHSYNWTSRIREVDNIAFLEKYKSNLEKIIETKQYVRRLTIDWNYTCKDTSLLPEISQLDMTYDIENELIAILEIDMQSIMYYACLGNGMKEWRFYSSDINETLRRIEKTLGGHIYYANISFSTENDTEWKDYKEINNLEKN